MNLSLVLLFALLISYFCGCFWGVGEVQREVVKLPFPSIPEIYHDIIYKGFYYIVFLQNTDIAANYNACV